jgi:trigger factor
MKVTLDREGQNIVHLGLEIEAASAEREYEKACRQISQMRNIPGFRRGKAPRAIIEKTFGIEYVKAVTLEAFLPKVLSNAIADEKIDLITQPQIESCTFELGSPLKFSAKFEVRPEVVLGAYSGISVKVPQAKLSEDALDKALSSIAQSKAALTSIPSRPVVEGDTVVLDFECFVDGKLADGGKAQGLILEVKEGSFIQGFCEQLVGKDPGNEFEVKVKFPEEYRNQELAGKEATFKVLITEVRQKIVPEINDELAKALNQPGLENLEQLKKALTEQLSEEVNQENEIRAQRTVVDAVVNAATVDIPQSMIERERDLLIAQVKQYLEQNNQNWEAFQESTDYQNLRDSKLNEARQRVLTSLVLGAVVREKGLAIDEDEVHPFLEELAARYNVPVQQVAQNEDVYRRVAEEVLTNKVVQMLLSDAKIEYVEDAGGSGSEPDLIGQAHTHSHGQTPTHSHGPDCSHEHDLEQSSA